MHPYGVSPYDGVKEDFSKRLQSDGKSCCAVVTNSSVGSFRATFHDCNIRQDHDVGRMTLYTPLLYVTQFEKQTQQTSTETKPSDIVSCFSFHSFSFSACSGLCYVGFPVLAIMYTDLILHLSLLFMSPLS